MFHHNRQNTANLSFYAIRFFAITIVTTILLSMTGNLLLWLLAPHPFTPVLWIITLFSSLLALTVCIGGLLIGSVAVVMFLLRKNRLPVLAYLPERSRS